MVMLVEVKGVGSFRIPEGTQSQDIRSMTQDLQAEQTALAMLQSGDTKLPGVSEEGEVLSQVIDDNTPRRTSADRPVFENQDGDQVSERTITEQIDGKWYNIPTVFQGEVLSSEEAMKLFMDAGQVDPVTGEELDAFDNVEAAVADAKLRSQALYTPEPSVPVRPEEPLPVPKEEKVQEVEEEQDNATLTPIERLESDRDQLAFDEGRRNKPYKDGKGHWTAGIGHLMTDAEKKEYPPGSKIPEEVVDQWFNDDIAEAYKGTERVLKIRGIPDLPGEVKSILTNMVFNMGVAGVLEFKETLKLIKKGDFKAASVEMLDSDWHRIDVGPRAVRLSDRMAKVKGFTQVASQ